MGTISKGIHGGFSGKVGTMVGRYAYDVKKKASDKDYHRPRFRVRVA